MVKAPIKLPTLEKKSAENQGNFPLAALLNEGNVTSLRSRHSRPYSKQKSPEETEAGGERPPSAGPAPGHPPRPRKRNRGARAARAPPPAPPLAGAAPGPALIGGVAIPDLHRPGSGWRAGARSRRRRSAAAPGTPARRGGRPGGSPWSRRVPPPRRAPPRVGAPPSRRGARVSLQSGAQPAFADPSIWARGGRPQPHRRTSACRANVGAPARLGGWPPPTRVPICALLAPGAAHLSRGWARARPARQPPQPLLPGRRSFWLL